MIKSELVARLTARYPHLYHRDVERIVTTMLDSITKALADGHRVELRGFGAFSVKVRPSRMGRMFGVLGMFMCFQRRIVFHRPTNICATSLAGAAGPGQPGPKAGRDPLTSLTGSKKGLNFQTLPVDAPMPL